MNTYKPVQQDDYVDASLTSNARLNFTKKVFSIVSAQLTFTTFISCLAMYSVAIHKLVDTLLIVALVGVVVAGLWLQFSSSASTQFPKNYILLSVFTVCESILVASIVADIHPPELVATAFLLTCGVVVTLTAYALTTKKDVTMGTSFLLLLSLSTCMLGLMLIFTRNPFIYQLYLVGGTFLFGIYLVYDIQLIIGGKGRQLSIDNYVLGSLMLYTDIIRIFLRILKLLNELNKKKE